MVVGRALTLKAPRSLDELSSTVLDRNQTPQRPPCRSSLDTETTEHSDANFRQ